MSATDPDEKLTRLEEAVAFGDRQSEVLSEEIASLNERARIFEKRLARLEQRLSDLAQGEDGVNPDGAVDRPPHSEG